MFRLVMISQCFGFFSLPFLLVPVTAQNGASKDPLGPNLVLESNASAPFFNVDGSVIFVCNATNHLRPDIAWSFQPCQRSCLDKDLKPNGPWENIDRNKVLTVQDAAGKNAQSQYPLTFRGASSGFIRCQVNTLVGSIWQTMGQQIRRVLVSDMDNGFDVKVVPERPVERQKIVMTCAANFFQFSAPTWLITNGFTDTQTPVVNGPRIQVADERNQYSNVQTLTIPSADASYNSQYRCSTTDITTGEKKLSRPISFTVTNAKAPEFAEHVKKDLSEKVLDYLGTLTLDCLAAGAPDPVYTWTTNGTAVEHMEGVHLEKDNSTLVFDKIIMHDNVPYTCVATNSEGRVEKTWRITVRSGQSVAEDPNRIWLIVGCSVGAVVLILVPVTIYACIRLKREQKRRAERENQRYSAVPANEAGKAH